VQFGANCVPWQHHFLAENAITGRSSRVQGKPPKPGQPDFIFLLLSAYIHLIYILSTANSDAQS